MIIALDPGIRGCGVSMLAGSSIRGSGILGQPHTVDHSTARLARAAYLKNPDPSGLDAAAAACMALEVWRWAGQQGLGSPGDLLVVEWPQVYQGGKQKGDPNDLLPLAGVDAAVAVLFTSVPVASYHPRDWKGQVDKDTCHARILERLQPIEITQLERDLQAVPKSLRHNVMDSVGIGLKVCGRFERKIVIARGG